MIDRKDNAEDKKTAQELQEIRRIIATIRNAASNGELTLLVSAAMSLISEYARGDNDLISSLSASSAFAETKIFRKEKEHKESEEKNIKPHTPALTLTALHKDLKQHQEIDVNLESFASLVAFAQENNVAKEKPNLLDGAFGEVIRSLEEKEQKLEHRADSVKRVDGLTALHKALHEETSPLSEAAKTELIEEAAKFKIKLTRSEDGELKLDDKSKKALDHIANLDMEEVEKKREARREAEKVDPEKEVLEVAGLGSLFGNDDDWFEEPPPPAKAAQKVAEATQPEKPTPTVDNTELHSKSVPEAVQGSSLVKTHNVITPEIIKEGAAVTKYHTAAKQGKDSGRSI